MAAVTAKRFFKIRCKDRWIQTIPNVLRLWLCRCLSLTVFIIAFPVDCFWQCFFRCLLFCHFLYFCTSSYLSISFFILIFCHSFRLSLSFCLSFSLYLSLSLSLFHSHTLRYLTLYPSFNRFNDESLHTFLLSVCLLVSLSVSLFLLTFVCGESQGTIESGRRRMAGSALHLLPRFMQRQRGQKSLDVSTPRFRAFLFFVFLFLLFLFSTFPPFILSVHLRLWNRVSLRPIEKETLLRSRVLSFSSIHPT